MKESALVLFLVLVLAGGIAWWSMRDQVAQPNQPAIVAPATAEPAKPPVIAKKRKANSAETSAPGQTSPEPPPPVAAASAAIPAELIVKPQPFPSVEQIHSGAQEEQIISTYGEPALSITTSDHDHVFETLVYSHERGELHTLIRIEDGKVLTAYSQSIPASFDAPASRSRIRH